MRTCKILGISCLFIASCEFSCPAFACNPTAYAWGLITRHPFITAAVIVVALNKEPWECIKETGSYFIEEHPILCIILLGLVLSGSFEDLSYFEHLSSAAMRYSARAVSLLVRLAERRFT